MTNKEVMHWINVCCLNYILTDPDSEEKVLEARDVISQLIKNNYKDSENNYKWISTNEELPEDDGAVLVSYQGMIIKAGWDSKAGCFYNLINTLDLINDHVAAWMPLPEPYNIRRETNK